MHTPLIDPVCVTAQTWPEAQLIAPGRPAHWTAPQAELCRLQPFFGAPSFWHVATSTLCAE
jgi:hypothetical protein